MAVRVSTGLRNYILDSGLATAFDTDGAIAIYAGAQPATADSDVTGTLLATCLLAADAAPPAAGGALTFNAIVADSTIDASGTAGWARIHDISEGVGGVSTTKKRIDIDIGQGGGTLSFDATAFVQGGIATISALSVTLPAS